MRIIKRLSAVVERLVVDHVRVVLDVLAGHAEDHRAHKAADLGVVQPLLEQLLDRLQRAFVTLVVCRVVPARRTGKSRGCAAGQNGVAKARLHAHL